jgi:hypothetical protein
MVQLTISERMRQLLTEVNSLEPNNESNIHLFALMLLKKPIEAFAATQTLLRRFIVFVKTFQ